MPFPNEHAARIADPDQFKSFHRKNDAFGPGIDVVFGRSKRGKAKVQSIRFPTTDWTAAGARRWLKDHGYIPLVFTPAASPRRNPRTNAAASRYTDAHWGVTPGKRFTVTHPEIRKGQHVVQMGELLSLRYRPVGQRKLQTLEFSKGAHLAFTPDAAERLIVLLSAEDRREILGMFKDAGRPWANLNDVALQVGARQADYTSPSKSVRDLGNLTHVVYRTIKEGDGLSDYVHRMGEDGGVEPALCMDASGYLYLAGGSYSVPDRGIIH